jgi:hypothetical protein
MSRSMLAAVALATTLVALFPSGNASAAGVAAPADEAVSMVGLVRTAGAFCGPFGCGPVWPGPSGGEWDGGRWGHAYRPACPIGYYYACRRGPLGYGQCACWSYRRW